MPYAISEVDSEFWVENSNTGRRMHKRPYRTKKEALRYLGALEANVSKSVKHGGFHSAAEKDKLQAIHDHAAAMGADCGGMDEAQAKGIKSAKQMMDDGMDADESVQYAIHEGWDIQQCCSVVSQLAVLCQSECNEGEMDEAMALCKIMMALMDHCQTECQDMMDGMEQAATGETGEKHTTSQTITTDSGAKISLSWVSPADKADAPDGDFLVVDKDGQHLRVKRNGKPDHGLMGGAWAALHQGFRGNQYEGPSKDKALAKLKELYKSEGLDTPDQKKSLNLDYVKALGIEIPDLAVKFVGRDAIKGYTFLWGHPEKRDMSMEYFSPATDFWDNTLGKSVRPLTWDHAQDDELKADPRIGEIVDFGDDEVGRWYEAHLNRAHRYRKAVDQMIKEGLLGTSSDSAPQYVVRERTGKSTWLKQWPWFASALTDVPCEPRMIGSIEILKSWGVALPDESQEVARQMEALGLRERELKLRSHMGGF